MRLPRLLLRTTGIVIVCMVIAATFSGIAGATPSTQIWIPSTDIQPFKTLHFNFDTYLRTQNEEGGERLSPVVVLGPPAGILADPLADDGGNTRRTTAFILFGETLDIGLDRLVDLFRKHADGRPVYETQKNRDRAAKNQHVQKRQTECRAFQ